MAAAATLLFGLPSMVLAQSQPFTGRIDVTVEDATGGRLPGVAVDLEGPLTQTEVTDGEGHAHFLNLAVGTYTVKAALPGFNAYSNPSVVVSAAAATDLAMRMSVAGTAENVNVTAVTPLVNTKKQTTATTFDFEELQGVPTARDPWVLLQAVPGVVVDRVNVGGNTSGQQSVFVGKGAQLTDSVWTLDGVPITDIGAGGQSPGYYAFDMFQQVAITTGGADAANATPGVQINLVLKKGSSAPSGSGHIFFANESLQSTNLSPALALAIGGQSGKGNRIDQYLDNGVDLGGPVIKDRLWVWGLASRTDVRNITLNGLLDRTTLNDYVIKADVQAARDVRLNFTYFDGNKTKHGRNAGPAFSPESTWDQSGPTRYYKGEGNFTLGNNLFAASRFAFVDAGTQLTPAAGLDAKAYFDDAGVAHGSYLAVGFDRPQYFASTDASYFRGKHEVRFGFSWRRTPVDSLVQWPGDKIVTIWDGYPSLIAEVIRDHPSSTLGQSSNLFATDTVSFDRLTLIGGLRFDHQTSSLKATTIQGVPGFTSLLPSATSSALDNAYEFNSIAPRLGMTYAIDESRKTVARASYANFASQLPSTAASFMSTIPYSYVYYEAVDLNHNNVADPNELGHVLAVVGGGSLTTTNNKVTMKAPRTHEFILGVDREVAPNFAVGAAFTWRRFVDLAWHRPAGVTRSSYVQVGTVTGTFPELGSVNVPYYASTVDSDGTWIAENRPDYHQTYAGFELNANKRLSNRWMLRASFSSNSWKEYFDNPQTAITNPTPSPSQTAGPGFGSSPGGNQSPYLSGPNVDGGVVDFFANGSGQSKVFVTLPKYQFTASGLYEGPWGVSAAASMITRQGYPEPFFRSNVATPDPYQPSQQVLLVSELDKFRLPSVTTFDVRLEKKLAYQRYRAILDLDIFNLFNAGTVLGRQYDVRVTTFNQVQEIMNPRLIRLGVRFEF